MIPSLKNTLRRCHSTVRPLMNSSAPISPLLRPSSGEAGNVFLLRCEFVLRVGYTFANLLTRGQQLHAVPVQRSFRHPLPRTSRYAAPSCGRVSTRRPSRRSHSPYTRWLRGEFGRSCVRARQAIDSPYQCSATSAVLTIARPPGLDPGGPIGALDGHVEKLLQGLVRRFRASASDARPR